MTGLLLAAVVALGLCGTPSRMIRSAHVGVVHRGPRPPHEALELEDEPDGGRTPWGEDDAYGG